MRRIQAACVALCLTFSPAMALGDDEPRTIPMWPRGSDIPYPVFPWGNLEQKLYAAGLEFEKRNRLCEAKVKRLEAQLDVRTSTVSRINILPPPVIERSGMGWPVAIGLSALSLSAGLLVGVVVSD